MEALLNRQKEICEKFQQIKVNFNKDSASRKTSDYIKSRIEALDELWAEFNQNNTQLTKHECRDQPYYMDNIYAQTKINYQAIRKLFTSFGLEEKATEACHKVDELLTQQRTNFRAFMRLVKSIKVDEISEKWELDDELQNIQSRWAAIDKLHLQIDNILQGSDTFYDEQFSGYEKSYKVIKRDINTKLCSTTHKQQATPQLEIPIFTGKYTHWPTFFDLFSEAVHNNKSIQKGQKMQHLKGRLRGEPERLIQHLYISAENYDIAWDILSRRYNNPQVLFTKHIEILLNQPIIHKQAASDIRRLHDTSMECINSIHNLGVDTRTWDPLLVHLLAKKLDSDTYSDFRESRKAPRELPSLEEFMSFLENKFTALEPITQKREKEAVVSSLSPKKFSSYQKYPPNNRSNNYNGKIPYKSYQAVPAYTCKCPLCNLEHNLYQCRKFINLTTDNKWKTVLQNKVCQNCLYKHYDNACLSTKRCKECNGEHNTLLHDAGYRPTLSSTSMHSATPSTSKQASKSPNVGHVASEDEEVLLTTISLKVQAASGDYITLRALLDQGSQISLISENAAQLLGLPRQRYHASIAGIGTGSNQSKGAVTLNCQSIYDDYQFSTKALVISKVINNLPNVSFIKNKMPHISNIKLADPEYNVSRPIDFLLDASIYSIIIMNGLIRSPGQNIIAQQTRLGWILSGNVKTFNCHVVINNLDAISKYWELEDITTYSSSMTEQEQYCEDFYQRTTRRLENGAYEVGLPMKKDFEQQLGISKPKAIAQFKQIERKLERNQQLCDKYRQFISEYQNLGHMCESNAATEPSCYLPHHGVMKLDSTTTALRVVFNASSKTSTGHSLNDLMDCGPNLQQDLQSLILNWRQYKYVITADIEKMFRTIFIRESDQHLQKIIWRDSPQDPLKDYQLTTVTYGMKAAPYLAMRTLRQLAKDDLHKYPLAAQAVESSFYMDDLLTGSNSVSQAKELQQQLIMMLKGAGMNLRKWSSNEPQLIQELSQEQIDIPLDFRCVESRKTLGLRWNASSDDFTFRKILDYQDDIKHHTKRQLLSEISKIFDPLGWLSPITVKAKLLFQRAWTSGITWDDQLPESIQNDWNALKSDMININQFTITRHLGNTEKAFTLHGFCDASQKIYSAAIYIITADDKGEYISKLVIAKTKLAPLNKNTSLPRLELCGAVLLAHLMQKVKESISCISKENTKVYAWTDSMVVLGWLKGDISRWKQFVANRVQQVTNIIEPSNWYHVRSENNAADCATRGLSSSQLKEHTLWWEGPKWLLSFNPNDITSLPYETPTIEVKKHKVHTALYSNNNLITDLLERHGSITRVVRTVAWISRFITKARKQNVEHATFLTSAELNNAYHIIIKDVQRNEFEEDLINIKKKGHVSKNSKIVSLNPFIDNSGLLRVGGRLGNSNVPDHTKHNIILSSHGRLTELIIDQGHITTLHGNARLALFYLRSKYWIIGGMCTIKRQLRKCVRCRRFNTSNHQQIMADLPAPRVTPSRPFSHTGVDFTGHMELKANKGRGIKTTKGYVAVFVCLSTKAVHLELVSDLSTPTFLAAFQRFCARRGTPSHVYSDNGTNFIGSNRVLKREYQEIIQFINEDFFNNISQMDIEWHFNAPAWPSAGGLWESAVKSFKYHLKRVLGEQKLTYEEFTTLIQQIEACLNSRPLGPLTENHEDEYLTPGHFLVGGPLLTRPQADPLSLHPSTRWQLVQALNKQLWKRWSAEYLQQLQARTKWRTPCRNMQLGDVVLIKEDNLPPGKWALARVQELHPGADGYVRVVTLKTQNNIIKRPVSKLALLPVNDYQSNDQMKPAVPRKQEALSQTATSATQPTQKTNTRSRRSGLTFNSLLMMLIIFISSISSSTQTNITALNENQGIFFDKLCNLQHVRDQWKLVVYYNMSTYWEGLSDVTNYIKHLNDFSSNTNCASQQYQTIASQLKHELSEIQHYNTLLRYQNSRHKRGLVDGIGYIANSLFGVLDERFAKQYEKDILHITQNENHLQKLLKNQTSIIEAEYNILRRHENIITEQFSFIKTHLTNISTKINEVENTIRREFYITSSSLAAYATLTNIRRIQQTLVETITDLSQGRIDPHLLSPEQLHQQINVISGQLHGDLTLPIDKDNIKDVYKLSRIAARVYNDYLIMEIKIPIVSSDVFELDKVISIPQKKGQQMYEVIPIYPYLAFNLQKDLVLFLSEKDMSSCLSISDDKLICSLNQPVYNFNIKQSLCDINVKAADQTTQQSLCKSVISTCDNRWIKLRRLNVWLYTCCEECKIRIFCPAGTEIRELHANGIIDIGQGCTLKSETLTIYGHNNFINQITVESDIKVPEVSILNNLINSTMQINLTELESDHRALYHQLRAQLDELKEQSETQITIHDVHHYTVSYIIIAVALTASTIIIYLKRCRRPRVKQELADLEPSASVSGSESEVSRVKVKKGNTVLSIEKGTSPMNPRIVRFAPLSDV